MSTLDVQRDLSAETSKPSEADTVTKPLSGVRPKPVMVNSLVSTLPTYASPRLPETGEMLSPASLILILSASMPALLIISAHCRAMRAAPATLRWVEPWPSERSSWHLASPYFTNNWRLDSVRSKNGTSSSLASCSICQRKSIEWSSAGTELPVVGPSAVSMLKLSPRSWRPARRISPPEKFIRHTDDAKSGIACVARISSTSRRRVATYVSWGIDPRLSTAAAACISPLDA